MYCVSLEAACELVFYGRRLGTETIQRFFSLLRLEHNPIIRLRSQVSRRLLCDIEQQLR